MSEVWSLESLKGRISSFYNEKQAAEKAAQGDMPSESDPQEKSAPGAEKHDGDSAEKTVLPSAGLEAENRDGKADDGIPAAGEASGKDPNGAGEGGHSAADGDSKDEAVKTPTDPSVAKTASKAKNLAEAIRTKLLNKEAKKKEADEDKEAKPLVGDQNQLPENLKDKIKAAEGEDKEAADAEAVAANFDGDANAYHKIANLVLNYEEGRQMVTELADRELGKQAAQNLIKEAAELESIQDAYEQEQQAAAIQVEEMLKGASAEDVQDIEKLMVVHSGAIDSYEYDFEKEAYDLGVKQAAAAMDAEGGELPMEGEDVSLDEVAAVIMQMVESGEIDPQLAEAILGELAGADGGGMEGGGEEAMMDPAMAEEAKMAAQIFGADTVKELQKTASLIEEVK